MDILRRRSNSIDTKFFRISIHSFRRFASSMAMDKVKSFFKGLKISVPDEIDPLCKKLNTFPIIAKPINGGSSNGIKILKIKMN